VPLPSAEHVARIAQCGSLDEKKQYIGNLIYPCI
jgi:Poly-adenylate binding protein, unique domain